MEEFSEKVVAPRDNEVRVNNIWKAKDGRRMRVTGFRVRSAEQTVKLDVLPPYQQRQRRQTEMRLEAAIFGPNGFMTKEAEFG